ncbi:hypothetical protein HUX88_13465 [Duganella sp. BJB1802]|uniref:hypothetical protein n=1 Tax=Duganella sp. BJB1802 TaxID=2744575 RepID=UPI00159360A0|nr:hypothetical protein [Duganella sp. BJB1802]NVD71554.1 hypothetical protein [Duganella sp. BJB1802]
MSAKTPNIPCCIAFAAALAGMQGSAFAAEQECYPSVERYMIQTFGDHYVDDENLIVRERTYGQQRFYVASDITPGTNHAEVLFKRTQQNRFCIALSTSMMAELRAVKFDSLGYPQEFVSVDQAPPGMPQQEVTYSLNAERTAFYAATCKEITFKGTRQVKKAVSCGAFFTLRRP